MKLKAVITKEAHAALTADVQALYAATPAGDKFVLDMEGVDDHPAVVGLKTALNSERDTAKSAQKLYSQLKAQIGDMDPEAARAALAKVQELTDKKLLDEGKVEELFAQRTERLQTDHKNQLSAKDAALKEATDKLTAKTGLIKKLTLEGEITRLAADPKIGIKPAMLPYVIGAFTNIGIDGVRWDLDEKDAITALKGDQVVYGKAGNAAMGIDEGFELLRVKAPDFFLPSTGSGASNTTARSATGAHIISRADASDPAKYRSARDAAEKANTTLQIATA